MATTKKTQSGIPQIGTTRMWQGRQSWNDERFFNLNGIRLRTRIERDSHNDQSYARLEVLNGLKWESLSHMHFSLWPKAAQDISYVMAKIPATTFDGLVDMLLADAKNLL